MRDVLTYVLPSSSKYVTRTDASTSVGLASRMNSSKNGPVHPSARNHRVDGALTPMLS